MSQFLELQARYDARDSFYGKARVQADYPIVSLWSYDTRVAQIEYNGQPDDKGVATVYGYYSQTTFRHIKEFLKQYGFWAENKKQILKDYGVKEEADASVRK
jgi:hypothetical protein